MDIIPELDHVHRPAGQAQKTASSVSRMLRCVKMLVWQARRHFIAADLRPMK
jgi:hypothetical protein